MDSIDCRTYIPPDDITTKMERLQRGGMIPIGQQEDYEYVAIQRDDGKWYTQRVEAEKPIEELRAKVIRNQEYMYSVERIFRREINELYSLIERRTIILTDIDEMYNDYV